jgi:type VI secretion system protein ImpJ
MSTPHRVIWSQGMFLRPHHFQQQERHLTHEWHTRVGAAHRHAWGFGELQLDESALAMGQLGLLRASGILPDGSSFAVGDHDPLPPALEIPADLREEWICLAVPRSRAGVTEVDWNNGTTAASGARWTVQDAQLRDATQASDDPEDVQTGRLNLRLVRSRDLGDGMAALAVARVHERRGQQVVVDERYIAPQFRIDGSRQLSKTAVLLHGLIRQQAQSIASGMGQVAHGVSEMSEFLKLMALNRAEPVWRQLAASPEAHPFEMHAATLALLGELATFEEPQRRPPEYPVYRHDDLQGCFAPLVADLRRLLSAAPLRRALQIELVERGRGVYAALVAETELLDSAAFVLAVNAQVPGEQLRQRVPSHCKLGPSDKLRDLVQLALPGIPLRPLPAAPRQLPFHAGFQYFELERGGELWQQLKPKGALAMHVAGEFPGLQLEFWAIRA